MNQVREYHPNLNHASKETISDSVELCETEDRTDVDFESSRSPAKSES